MIITLSYFQNLCSLLRHRFLDQKIKCKYRGSYFNKTKNTQTAGYSKNIFLHFRNSQKFFLYAIFSEESMFGRNILLIETKTKKFPKFLFTFYEIDQMLAGLTNVFIP